MVFHPDEREWKIEGKESPYPGYPGGNGGVGGNGGNAGILSMFGLERQPRISLSNRIGKFLMNHKNKQILKSIYKLIKIIIFSILMNPLKLCIIKYFHICCDEVSEKRSIDLLRN